MPSDRPTYTPSAWLLVAERIGRVLRERYRPPEELPPTLLTMLGRLHTKLEVSVGEAPDHGISELAG
jgi:hypothetical protein